MTRRAVAAATLCALVLIGCLTAAAALAAGVPGARVATAALQAGMWAAIAAAVVLAVRYERTVRPQPEQVRR